jgi:ethanolamine ammonia-lyase small subunit
LKIENRKSGAAFDPWRGLGRFTAARIGLGRAGGSLPTRELLDFAMDHAEARDAVHAELDVGKLREAVEKLGVRCVELETRARDRLEYLQRPDLGRRLSEESAEKLRGMEIPAGNTLKRELQYTVGTPVPRFDVAIVLGDGLSAMAAEMQIPGVLGEWLPMLRAAGMSVGPVAIVRMARVAVEDEVGEILRAKAAVILLGERPGLGTADSLGAYLVFGPKVGRKDGERNCVSNIRAGGLGIKEAARTLDYLLREAVRRGLSGVGLKDERGGKLLG